MSITPGTSLGAYQLVSLLGEGGMGEVYRARDTRLNREVAVKVLPAAVAADPERMARFRREAQLLAALNHPNIAAIYGIEEAQGQMFLVLELVEGEDLAQRLKRGPIPQGEAIAIAKQIVEALEEAHERGIVHRDLKPANIKVRPDGRVKVLDFGLAKASAIEPASGPASFGDTPTLTHHTTAAGMLMGTAAYMSPEQARGRAVDRRADIWAFGVVLFEMLAGKPLFGGETLSDTLAAVLREEIDWRALPPGTPEPVKHLLARCLDRDTKARLQAIGEARVALLAPATNSPSVRWRWVAVAVLSVAAVGAAIAWSQRTGPPKTAAPASVKPRSIAVLPFANSGGQPDDAYLADGMTDELIAALGKVPGLHVAARSSAFSFKGQNADVREVAKRLGVDSVLEGSIRRSGPRLRVNAALVNAADGLQLWSDTFESEGGDAFSVQDAVTRGVVSGLALQLGGTALAASQAGRTTDPVAHDLYLRGLSSFNATSEADLRRALDYYQQAIARDPNFALAYAGIGWVYTWLADAYMPGNEAYPKAAAAARAAIDRDPLLADAHAVLGYSLSVYDWDREAAERELNRALELDPNSANTHFFRGIHEGVGLHTDAALKHLDRATQLDPLSPLPYFAKEVCLYWGGRYQETIDAHRKTEEIAPGFVYVESFEAASYRELGNFEESVRAYEKAQQSLGGQPLPGLAITYARMGRMKDAKDTVRRVDAIARTSYVPLIWLAGAHDAIGDREGAVRLLEQSLAIREAFFISGKSLPEIASLRSDPRVQKLLEQTTPLKSVGVP